MKQMWRRDSVWNQSKWRWMDRGRFPTTCYQCRLNQTERIRAWIWQTDAVWDVREWQSDKAVWNREIRAVKCRHTHTSTVSRLSYSLHLSILLMPACHHILPFLSFCVVTYLFERESMWVYEGFNQHYSVSSSLSLACLLAAT